MIFFSLNKRFWDNKWYLPTKHLWELGNINKSKSHKDKSVFLGNHVVGSSNKIAITNLDQRTGGIVIHGTHNGNLTYIDILDKRRHENVNVSSFPGWDAFGRSGNNVFSLILNPWGKIYAQV